MSQHSTLSRNDVARLLAEPSAENRAATAEKVGAYFASEAPTEAERKLAEDIFRAMVRDAELRVRKALAETLKESPELPHDVAVSLANDVDEVALPVIESSVVLSDEDLVEIIEAHGSARQLAVARRAIVPPTVAERLAEKGDEEVVATLAGNEGAQLHEATLERMIDRFPHSDAVKTPLVHRESLPLKVAERLVSMVSESLREHLATHHELSPAVAADLVLESRERATVTLLTPGHNAPDVLALVEQLHRNGRLTPTLVIRALCMGDLTFFEAALAKRAGIAVANAYQLVHDRGELGLARLFEKADMPASLLKVARIGVSIAREMGLTGGDDRETFRKVMIERVLTHLDAEIDGDNVDYLIAKLGQKAA
ncbi:MAG: DUF2336 domain-containing protein [Rhodothalassiaceae bacterium]